MSRREIIEEYTNITSLTYEMVGKLIEFVNIGKRDPITKEIPIEINWNFDGEIAVPGKSCQSKKPVQRMSI